MGQELEMQREEVREVGGKESVNIDVGIGRRESKDFGFDVLGLKLKKLWERKKREKGLKQVIIKCKYILKKIYDNLKEYLIKRRVRIKWRWVKFYSNS